MGKDENMLTLDELKRIYEDEATNMKKARQRGDFTLQFSPTKLD